MGRVTFELNQREDVSLYIYNINGKLIKTISQQNMVMGKHTLDLDMSGIGKGTYIIELKAGSINEVTRFIKLK